MASGGQLPGGVGTILPLYIEGGLKKLGGMGGRSQQQRWFELRGQQLVYYSEQPRGVIDLSGGVQIKEEADGEAWTLTGAHLSHPYTLSAASGAERAQWLRMIRQSMKGPQEGYLDARIQSLEHEREALFATSEQLGKEIVQKNQAIAQLTTDVGDRGAALSDTLHKLQEAEHRCAQLESQLQAATRGASDAAREAASRLAELSQQTSGVIADLRASCARKEARGDELEASLRAATARGNGLAADLEASVAREAALAGDLERQRDDLSARLLQQASESLVEKQAVQRSFAERLAEHEARAARQSAELDAAADQRAALEKAAAAGSAALRRTQEEIGRQREELAAHDATIVRLRRDEGSARAREASLGVLARPLSPPAESRRSSGGGTGGGDEERVYKVVGPQGVVVRKAKATGSERLCVLPTGAAVLVASVSGRRAQVTAPVPGWVSLATSGGLVILEEAPAAAAGEQAAADPPLQVGELCRMTVERCGSVAGVLDGVVAAHASDGGYRVFLRPTALREALGCGSNVVAPAGLVARGGGCGEGVEWATYDSGEGVRSASSSAYNHPPGYGCNRGRLSSPFAWFAQEEDTAPAYTIDLCFAQPVAGVAIGDYVSQDLTLQAFVTEFTVEYAVDADAEVPQFLTVAEEDDGEGEATARIFSRGGEGASVEASAHRFFEDAARHVIARYVRIRPRSWVGSAACMRAGVVVAATCYPAAAYRVDPVVSDPDRNVWLKSGKRDAELLEMQDKAQALQALAAEVHRASAEFEREKADFSDDKRRLTEANALLAENVHTLQSSGHVKVKRTVVLTDASVCGALRLEGTTVASRAANSGLEQGMTITNVNGTAVENEGEVRAMLAEWAQSALDSDDGPPLPLTVLHTKTSGVVVSLGEELEALRAEIRRQHQVINNHEAETERRSHGSPVCFACFVALLHAPVPHSAHTQDTTATRRMSHMQDSKTAEVVL